MNRTNQQETDTGNKASFSSGRNQTCANEGDGGRKEC